MVRYREPVPRVELILINENDLSECMFILLHFLIAYKFSIKFVNWWPFLLLAL